MNYRHSLCFVIAFLILWLALYLLPFVRAILDIFGSPNPSVNGGRFYLVVLKSLGIAGLIASLSVALGAIPGKLLAQSHRSTWVLLLMIVPLVLPRYVQYYAWSLLSSPTTSFGQFLAGHAELATAVGAVSTMIVLVFWYWPLAGLLLARGWNTISGDVLDAAALETTKRQRLVYITVPLLWRSVVLSFSVCFILILSEFSTFHLAGVTTMGTSLAVLYEMTGSEGTVLKASWPLVLISFAVGLFLHRELIQTKRTERPSTNVPATHETGEWFFFGGLIVVSVVLPLMILVANVRGSRAFVDFMTLHSDELAGSLLSSTAAIGLACFLAYGAKRLSRFGSWGHVLRGIVYTGIFAGMLLPGSLVGVFLLKTASLAGPYWSRQWWMVSAGQAVRVCGIALILLELGDTPDSRHAKEMAEIDGAGHWARFRYIYLPQNRHYIGAVFLLLLMISVTELPATMVLLGAGVPNFAQRLLNQMHYARDDQVVASCLILIFVFVLFSVIAAGLLKRAGRTRFVCLLAGLCFFMAGCDRTSNPVNVKVVRMFGSTGRGKLEFMYPRAIDLDGSLLYVIDKAGRIQKISIDGEYLGEYQMPEIEAGKPTGISIGPEGNIYVADTHYHRVLIFDSEGTIVSQFGSFGEAEGQFIYPTDVAFDTAGHIFVSEYGGNDRISVFNTDGRFKYCFGEPGNGKGQLSRPSALCFDSTDGLLYVADACNHRIVVYTPEGRLVRYIGSVGTTPGCLRYPYDLALCDDRRLIVCEYGNNRIQVFSTEGDSLGVYGQAGRSAGELAYPWGVVADQEYAYIVDAGNNRIQVWDF